MPKLSPLRVAPGGRYFETCDNEPFLFIGPNDALPWPGLNKLFRRRDPAAVDAYLEDLAANGVTILRLMLEYAHHEHRYFEKPVGRFVPAMVRLWDDLFAGCERFGLRVLLAPYDNFWMARRWHHHPYNQVNGGPATSPQSFFTDEATIAATSNRLQFVAERWGGSGALGAWDLFNEIHPYWGGSPAEQEAVVTRIGAAVRETEQRRWGFSRPQTVSIFGPDPAREGYADLIFRAPGLDFATTHIYHSGPIDHPTDTVAPALEMARWTRHGLAGAPPGRPFTDTEHGPIHLFNDHKKSLPEPFDDEYERHLMWAHLASGGAGSGMRWPARNPHVLSRGMKRALKSLADFSRLLDWRHFSPRDACADVALNVGEPLHVFAVGDERQAVAWLLRPAGEGHVGPLPAFRPLLRSVGLQLRGFAPGMAFDVFAWDTKRGELAAPCARVVVGADGVLGHQLDRLGNDLALAFRIAAG